MAEPWTLCTWRLMRLPSEAGLRRLVKRTPPTLASAPVPLTDTCDPWPFRDPYPHVLASVPQRRPIRPKARDQSGLFSTKLADRRGAFGRLRSQPPPYAETISYKGRATIKVGRMRCALGTACCGSLPEHKTPPGNWIQPLQLRLAMNGGVLEKNIHLQDTIKAQGLCTPSLPRLL